MLPISLSFKPNVDTLGSRAQVGLGLTRSNLIRIKNGYIQSLPGYRVYGTDLYNEAAGAMIAWVATVSLGAPDNAIIGIGTFDDLEVNFNGVGQDITPAAWTGSTPWFLATWGNWLLAASPEDQIYYWIPSFPLSGSGLALPLSGLTVGTIAGSGSSYVSGTGATTIATTTATGIQIGESITLSGVTGTGGFAGLDGTWIVTSIPSATTFTFTATTGFGATTITGGSILAIGAPSKVNGIFVAAPQQQAFAWGVYSATLGDQDPLLLAWCDVGNLAVWSAEVNNQAGSFKLSSGSLIVAGTWVGLTAIIWTDLDMWVANYIGFPLIYSFNRVAQNCGLIAPKAWGVLGNMVAWMGQYDFFVYEGGSVRPMPCTVRDYVFNTIDRGFVGSVHCCVNTAGNEIMWRFPQGHLSGGICTAYVKWSPAENSWDFGEGPPNISAWADISGWHDQNGGSYPLGIDYSGNILVFETDYDFPLSTVDIFYITGWFYIAEGQEMVTVERVNPDFVFNPEQGFATPSSGAVNMTFYFADEIPATETDYPVRTYGPYLVTDQTPYIIVRGRGRVMQVRVDVVQGSFFRNGKHMARISIDGHR